MERVTLERVGGWDPENSPALLALDNLADALERITKNIRTYKAELAERRPAREAVAPAARRQRARIRAAAARRVASPDGPYGPYGKHRTRGQVRTLRADLKRARAAGVSGPKLAKKHGISTAYVYYLTNGGRP